MELDQAKRNKKTITHNRNNDTNDSNNTFNDVIIHNTDNTHNDKRVGPGRLPRDHPEHAPDPGRRRRGGGADDMTRCST